MKNKNLVAIISNTTHLQTLLRMTEAIRDNNATVLIILDLSRPNYSKGLTKLATDLPKDFKVSATTKLRLSWLRIIDEAIAKNNLAKQLKGCKSLLVFTEGGVIEWIALGIAKKLGIKTYCLQWAITWTPETYNAIHGRALNKPRLKDMTLSFVRGLIGLNYTRMTYLGDGGAQHLLTMGEFWTQQFKREIATHPNKFITTGNPRFERANPVNISDKADVVCLALGAGTALYNDSQAEHLKKIETIYTAFSKSNWAKSGKLIHKLHPRDTCIEPLKELANTYPSVQLYDGAYDINELLEQSKVVITERSSLGFEALLHNCRLVVYEDGKTAIGFNYASEGLAQSVSSEHECLQLFNQLENTYNDNVDISFYIKTQNNSLDVVQKVLGCPCEIHESK